jgi:hypothetical protein
MAMAVLNRFITMSVTFWAATLLLFIGADWLLHDDPQWGENLNAIGRFVIPTLVGGWYMASAQAKAKEAPNA